MVYVAWLDNGGEGVAPSRPPGAEAFLPIASFMSLSYLIQTGDVHTVHSAGLYLFIAFLLMSWVAGRAFCAWVCPFGLISESLDAVHRKLFKRRTPLSLPPWLDWPLRSLKYLLLLFFVVAILQESAHQLLLYLDSPYHAVADIKMYRFFANITPFALYVILGLIGLSFLIPFFWCRYLCPYGALMGVVGLLSPFRIHRDAEACTDCGYCTRTCPSRIKVDQSKWVVSDECTSCMQCVDGCPVPEALDLVVLGAPRRRARSRWVAAVVGLIFLGSVGLALMNGHWWSSISPEQTLDLYPGIDTYLHTD